MPQRSLEIVAATVESAVEQGLKELKAQPAQVIVEVLEEPSAGLFGVGGRPARVRLNLLAEESTPRTPEEFSSPGISDHYPPDDLYQTDDMEDEGDLAEGAEFSDAIDRTFAEILPDIPENEWDDEVKEAQTVLRELLERMERRANLRIGRAGEEADAPWLLSLEGAQMAALVGRRGEGLAALQFLARLIVSRRLDRRCFFVLDADGYKGRRTDKLRALAERIAIQAISQRRTMTLEPMPPNERRVIHMALREREDVETISVGEGEGRKVTVIPR